MNTQVDSQSVIVHALIGGRMACGLDKRSPKEWPKCHVWAKPEFRHLVTCVACQKAVK